jgi:hypothetical protein
MNKDKCQFCNSDLSKTDRSIIDPKELVSFGWAPGGYFGRSCVDCGENADGDKRCWRCRSCAEKAYVNKLVAVERTIRVLATEMCNAADDLKHEHCMHCDLYNKKELKCRRKNGPCSPVSNLTFTQDNWLRDTCEPCIPDEECERAPKCKSVAKCPGGEER